MTTRGGSFKIGGDLTVHRLGFGAMRLTGPGIWGPPEDVGETKRIDPKVPRDEQFGVMQEMQREGLVHHLGLSEVNVEEIEAASRYFQVVTVQNEYNVANRKSEDVLGYCERKGIGFIPWFPLASGKLAQPGGALDSIAQRLGARSSQVALAWLLRRSPVILPIPGTSKVSHLDANVKAAELELTDEDMSALHAVGRTV